MQQYESYRNDIKKKYIVLMASVVQRVFTATRDHIAGSSYVIEKDAVSHDLHWIIEINCN